MSSKKQKSIKLISLISFFSVGVSFSAFALSFKDNIVTIANTLASTSEDNSNYQPVAKVDPMYTIYPIRKANNDANAINLLYLGNGYSTSESKTFADYVYNNRVKGYFNGENENKDVSPSTTFTRLFNNLNAYAIVPNFTGDDSASNYKGFFGFETGRNYNSMANFGYKKANMLNFDFVNNFADDGAFADPTTLNIINKNGSTRAVTSASVTLTGQSDDINTGMHELGHSAFGLADEYGIKSFNGPNRHNSLDNVTQAKWKEFFRYRGVGAFNAYGNDYIPTSTAKMNVNTADNFNEVSEHHISKRINNKLGLNQDLYIADPQLLAIEDNFDLFYSFPLNTAQKEIFDENIENANGKTLDLRTVVDNWSDKQRKFKLVLKITDSAGKQKYAKESEVYTVAPNKTKGMVVTSDAKMNNIVAGDKISGELIDVDTNKVLATNKDRFNKAVFEIINDEVVKSNLGRKVFNVNVDYKIQSTNQPVPNTYPVTLRYMDGDIVPINKVLFNGYKFVKSSVSNLEVKLNGKDQNVTLYYEPLNFKNINLKLFDEDRKTVIKEKKVKVYEHQTFTPKNTDFWVNDLENVNSQDQVEKQWLYKTVPEPEKKSYSYDAISDNSETINYYKTKDNSDVIVAKENVTTLKGEQFILSNTDYANYYSHDYDYEPGRIPPVIYNDVDINTPGNYKVIYYASDTSTATMNVTVKDRTMPAGWTPDVLGSEVNRVSSLFFLTKNSSIKRSEFDKISNSNLLSYIKNPVENNDKFKYEVDIKEKQSSSLNFSINVVYNNQKVETKNTWHLYFNDIVEDTSTVYPPPVNPNPPVDPDPVVPDKPDPSEPDPPVTPENPKTDISNNSQVDIIDPKQFYYTGKEIIPKVEVRYNSQVLIENTDYTVSYTNNVNVGLATITVTGINNYTGSNSTTFTIEKVVDNKVEITVDENNNIHASSSVGQVKYKYFKNPENPVYVAKPTENGEWYVIAYVEETDNYNGFSSTPVKVQVTNYSDFNQGPSSNNNQLSSNNNLPMILGIIGGVLVLGLVATGLTVWKLKYGRKKFKTIKVKR